MLLLPRGNRKTPLCAAITLLHLIRPERLPGGRIISAASTREQARELFREAALIVENDQRLKKQVPVRDYTSTITFKKERIEYRAIYSDGAGQHKKTPNVVIMDELHAWRAAAGDCFMKRSALVKVPGTLSIIASTSRRAQENLA